MNSQENDENSAEGIKEEIDRSLNEVEALSKSDSEKVLSLLMTTTVMINGWFKKTKKNITNTLSIWVRRIKNLLASLASKMGAQTYSISVGYKVIAVTVSWDVVKSIP